MPMTIVDDYNDQAVLFSGFSENVPESIRSRRISFLEPSTRVRITDEFEGSSYYETGLYIAVE